jgi:hypothetical protein
MSLTPPLQSRPLSGVPVERQPQQPASDLHSGDRQSAAHHLDLEQWARHSLRVVVRHGDDWYLWCACGFTSTGCLSKAEALAQPCEIAALEAVSRRRLARVLG